MCRWNKRVGRWLVLAGLLALQTLGTVAPTFAAEFLVILDHSGSMGSADSMEPAKEALRQAMAEMSTPGAEWGLRVYGSNCCSPDTELLVPISSDGRQQIVDRLPSIQGIAGSPMPAALEAAREQDFGGEAGWLSRRHALVLSDGEVDREGACREARLLRESGVRVTVIGFAAADTPEGSETLRYIATDPHCAAGRYIRIDRPNELAEALARWSQSILTFPFRILSLFLASLAGYYTTKFLEYSLERMTEIPRHFIPRLCTSVLVLWVALSAGLYLDLSLWLWLLIGLVPGAVTFFLRRSVDDDSRRRNKTRRTMSRIPTSLIVFALGIHLLTFAPTAVSADVDVPPPSDCSLIGSEARSAAGNEDLFVFLDSSLSMGPTSYGPWATGYMEPARRLLLDLVDCYLRDGDFLLVSTFDSSARVEIAKELGSERERATLRRQIVGLEPGRPQYFRRVVEGRPADEAMPPPPGQRPAGQVLGGAWKTDLGEMLSLASDLLDRFAEPRNRQVMLFFTDGEHDPPEFTRFRDEVTLDPFLERDDLAIQNLQIGVVAIPKEPGDVTSALRLAEMFARIDPEKLRRDTGQVGLIEPEDENPTESFIARLAEFLRLRIALDAPPSLHLGRQVTPELDETFTVRNETRVERSLDIESADFETADGSESLAVEPRRFDLAPGETRTLRVHGRLNSLPVGEFEGALRFEFASAIVFHPHQVAVSGIRQGWMERYGWMLQISGLILCLAAFLGITWWRRPRWIAAVWTDGRVVNTSVPKQIAVSQSLKVGASGFATLALEGPDTRLGEVTRTAVHRYELSFDPVYLDAPGSAGSVQQVFWGVWYSIPGSDTQKIQFRTQRSRSSLSKLLSGLRRTDESRGSGGSEKQVWTF